MQQWFLRLCERYPRFWHWFNQRFVLPWSGMSASEQLTWVASVLRRDGRVLEVGIGIGDRTQQMFAQRPALFVVGLDPSLAALQAHQAALEAAGIINITLVCSDPAILPFAADGFDQVICLDLLHQVERYQPVIDELLRVAVDGATVVGTAAVATDEPRSGLQRWLSAARGFAPLDPDALHELLGMTWSKLNAQRTGAIYAFRRFALDRSTGEVLPHDH